MKMNVLNKMGVWLVLTALTSTPVIAHHSSHPSSQVNPLPLVDLQLFFQGRLSWIAINADLNVLLLSDVNTAPGAVLTALNTAYNTDLAAWASSLSTALQGAGASASAANNLAVQLDAYAIAAENYAVSVNRISPGTPTQQQTAANAWQAQVANLIAAIVNLSPSIDPAVVTGLVSGIFSDHEQIVLDAAAPTPNFPGAVAARNQSAVLVRELNFYIFDNLFHQTRGCHLENHFD